MRSIPALLLLLLTAPLLAQPEFGGLVNQQLDRLVTFRFNNAALPDVIRQIEQASDVPVRVGDDVYDLLPWGRQTPINATLENVSLRQSLALITRTLALRYELTASGVELRPVAALLNLARRATVQELQTYSVLSEQPLRTDRTRMSVAELIDVLEAMLPGLGGPAGFSLDYRPGAQVDSSQQLYIPRGATVTKALDELALQTRLAWYPWDSGLVIVSRRDVVRQMLERTITVAYDRADIAEVLTDLPRRTGVPLLIEPGALQRVPPAFRTVRLMAQAPARQVFESLAGTTGLGYVTTDDGVYIWNNSPTPAGSDADLLARPIASVEVVPGSSILIYADDLGPDERQRFEAARATAIDLLRSNLRPVEPATQPAD